MRAENDAAFAAGWEAAMRFADYPRSYDERDWDTGDVADAYRQWKIKEGQGGG